MSESSKNYNRIIRSSSIIGGAQGINMLVGILRVKCIAVLIGPLGVGLAATYQSMIQLIATLVGVGIQSSAVRDITKASDSGDSHNISKVIISVRRVCWLTGIIGLLLVLILAPTLSHVTFGDGKHQSDIAALGLAVLCFNLKGGQIALIQGLRRIEELAKLRIIGVISGTIISVAMYWQLGLSGIVPSIVALSITELCASWWYARKIHVPKVSLSWKDSVRITGGMIRLGLAFMWSGLLLASVAFFTRTIITYEIDLVAVGIFSASFSLSGMVVNFILGAMGADYYPSLIAISDDHKKMCKMVNQQTEVGLLLALPGLLATLSLAPIIIDVFYTPEFEQSADLLRWFALGCVGRVISWPLGFVLLAKGLSKVFVITESLINAIHVLLIIVFIKYLGIEGVAIAYPLLYLIYTFMMLIISRKLIGFKWSKSVISLLVLFLVTSLFIFSGVLILDDKFTIMVIGTLVTFFVGAVCLKMLASRLDSQNKIGKFFSRLTRLYKSREN